MEYQTWNTIPTWNRKYYSNKIFFYSCC